MKILMLCGARYHWMRQRPTHLAQAFLKAGHEVYFLSADRTEEGVAEDGAIIITEPRRQAPVVDLAWVSFGGGVNQLPGIEYDHLVFDNLDADMNGAWAEGEAKLLPLVDTIFCTSQPLYNKRNADYPGKVFMTTNGVEVEDWQAPVEMPADMRNLPRPIYGYMGAVAEWLDIELLEYLGRVLDGTVMLVGPEFGVSRKKVPSCYFTGLKSYAELSAYVRNFDVGLIPFNKSEIALSADPIKFYQYQAAGLNVLSTPIPKVEHYAEWLGEPHVYVRESADWLATLCDDANILMPPDGEQLRIKNDFLERVSWDAVFADIKRVLNGRGVAV